MVQHAGLTPSQREQVIQALLAERRSRLRNGSQQQEKVAGGTCPAPHEQHLQQLTPQRQQDVRDAGAGAPGLPRQHPYSRCTAPCPSSQPAPAGAPASCNMSEGLLSPGSSNSMASLQGPPPVQPPWANSILAAAPAHTTAAAAATRGPAVAGSYQAPSAGAAPPVDPSLGCPSPMAPGQPWGPAVAAAVAAAGGPVDISSLWQEGDNSVGGSSTAGSDTGGDRRHPAAPNSRARSRQAAPTPNHKQHQQQRQRSQARSVTPGRSASPQCSEGRHGGKVCAPTTSNRHSREAALARAAHQDKQQQPGGGGISPPRRTSPLPASYPASREERLQQLAAPRTMAPQRALQLQAQREAADLAECRFQPVTGRPPAPTHQQLPPDLPAAERLYVAAQQAARRRAKKAEQLAAAELEGCTFRPAINAAATAYHLRGCTYEPLDKRLGQLLRNRAERRAALQQAVEGERQELSPHTPAINPVSAAMAEQRKWRLQQEGACGQQQQQQQRGRSMQRGPRGVSASPGPGGGAGRLQAAVAAVEEVGGGLRRTKSEADLAARAAAASCTFSPAINPRSQQLLARSGEIPAGFLARQAWFWARQQEKAAALAAALEDGECSFSPGGGGRGGRWAGGQGEHEEEDAMLLASRHVGLLGETFLERIERLAYKDAQVVAARRQVAAAQAYADCTFTPAINPRSARMAKELHDNSRAKARRAALAAEQQQQLEEACTFQPEVQGAGRAGSRSRSSSRAREDGGCGNDCQLALPPEDWVDRLYQPGGLAGAAAGGGGGGAGGAAAGRRGGGCQLAEERELAECTFRPAINPGPPPPAQGPVPVPGLGRFLELKALAAAKAAAAAEREAQVFHTAPRGPSAPFTIPQPFRLTPQGGPRGPKRYDQQHQQQLGASKAAQRGGGFGGQGAGRDQGPMAPRGGVKQQQGGRGGGSRALIQAILDGDVG